MLTHVFDQRVLVICFPSGISIANRAAAVVETEHLLHTHRPRHVVLELAPDAITPTAVSLVLRTHRLCRTAGASLAVVTPLAEAQHLLTANAGDSGPPTFGNLAEAVRWASHGHEVAS